MVLAAFGASAACSPAPVTAVGDRLVASLHQRLVEFLSELGVMDAVGGDGSGGDSEAVEDVAVAASGGDGLQYEGRKFGPVVVVAAGAGAAGAQFGQVRFGAASAVASCTPA